MKSQLFYPLITIGIPSYNRCKSIVDTLSSIWSQHYPNLQVIISDNCSQDDTEAVVRGMCKSHPEIAYHRQKVNIGMVANFEYVLRNATGKYFMWVADDDTLAEGVLLKYVSFLEHNLEYSIVSGKIKYWLDDKQSLLESGFTFEQKSSSLRVIAYYSKVVYGGMIHGLMRRELTKGISFRQVIGNDYHFIANLAYLGEIKHFDFVGYHKKFGGVSRNFRQYARQLGESEFAGTFPHIKMACDAFAEVMYRSPIYSEMSFLSKFTLASSSFSSIVLRYYGRIFPYMVGGKLKRFITHPIHLHVKH